MGAVHGNSPITHVEDLAIRAALVTPEDRGPVATTALPHGIGCGLEDRQVPDEGLPFVDTDRLDLPYTWRGRRTCDRHGPGGLDDDRRFRAARYDPSFF